MLYQIELVVHAEYESLDHVAHVAAQAGLEAYGSSIDSLTTVTFYGEASNEAEFAEQCLQILKTAKVDFLRAQLDLVSIPDIAARAGVNRETARLWAEGKRKSHFPTHFVSAGPSKLWFWADAHQWLHANNLATAADYNYQPVQLATVQKINAQNTNQSPNRNKSGQMAYNPILA